jgi:hypothetical protein
VELATGPLPSRASRLMASRRPADPWGEFLERVLPSAEDADMPARAADVAPSARRALAADEAEPSAE